MSLAESLWVALESLWANKLRSFLTTLGIIIGVGAVIAVVAIGQGGQAMVVQEIRSLGTDLVLVVSVPREDERGRMDMKYLEAADLEDIESKVPSVLSLSPEVSFEMQVWYGSSRFSEQVTGVSDAFQVVRDIEMEDGQFLRPRDIERRARVAVLGREIASELFPGGDYIGNTVYLDGLKYTVIGVMAPRKRGMFMGDEVDDRSILIPYTTLQRLTGTERIDILFVKAHPGRAHVAAQEIEEVLEARHGEGYFELVTLEQAIEAVERVTGILTTVVAGVAAVALLVGGIGIMNIMLVSVTERTREIGLRKAIGAKRSDILWQFIIEAVVLSGTGGILGIAFGAMMVEIASMVMGLPSLVSPGAVVMAFSFSALVGIVFGVYPASKAANLDPIDALRYE